MTGTKALRQVGINLVLTLSLLVMMVPAMHTFAEGESAGESVSPAENSGEAAPASAVEPAPVVTLPGKVQISLYGANGVGLSGLFAITDATGTYHELWVEAGYGMSGDLAVGPASIAQISGTIDYWFDGTAAQVAQVPSGDVAVVQFANNFVDTDGDGIGDSADLTPNGDTDGDDIDNLADLTPNGDTDGDGIDNPADLTPNGDTDGDGIDNLADLTPNGDPTAAPTTVPSPTVAPSPTSFPTVVATQGPVLASTPEVSGDISVEVEVAAEPVIVEVAPVSCQDAESVSPWILSDLEDYPPGGLVTLSSGSWVPGQVVEILVEDDGIADAEQGEWNHFTTVTADGTGNFSYSFNIASWFVADYSVVATGECSKAETSFTDSFTGGSCTQLPGTSDVVTPPNYVTFICPSSTVPKISVSAPSDKWQWNYTYSNSTTPPIPSALTWTSADLANSDAGGNIRQVYLFLRPDVDAPAGSMGEIEITITKPNSTIEYTSKLTAYVAISTSNFELTCEAVAPTPPQNHLNLAATSLCTVTAKSPMGSSQLQLQSINGTRNTYDGWTVALASAPVSASSWSAPIALNSSATYSPSGVTLSADQTYQFVVSFTPVDGCIASSGAPSVDVSVKVRAIYGGVLSSQQMDSSTVTVSSSYENDTRGFGVRIDEIEDPVAQDFSLSDTENVFGSLSVSYSSAGCGTWYATAQIGTFSRTDGLSAPSVPYLADASPVNPGTTGAVNPLFDMTSDPLLLTMMNTNDTEVAVTQDVELIYTIPGGTLVGNYKATITVTATGDAP